MYKQISIIFACIVSCLAITGCGIKGPLYQTPSENIEPDAYVQSKGGAIEQSNLNISTSKR
jgi:predicted small lipoprotein YifL